MGRTRLFPQGVPSRTIPKSGRSAAATVPLVILATDSRRAIKCVNCEFLSLSLRRPKAWIDADAIVYTCTRIPVRPWRPESSNTFDPFRRRWGSAFPFGIAAIRTWRAPHRSECNCCGHLGRNGRWLILANWTARNICGRPKVRLFKRQQKFNLMSPFDDLKCFEYRRPKWVGIGCPASGRRHWSSSLYWSRTGCHSSWKCPADTDPSARYKFPASRTRWWHPGRDNLWVSTKNSHYKKFQFIINHKVLVWGQVPLRHMWI